MPEDYSDFIGPDPYSQSPPPGEYGPPAGMMPPQMPPQMGMGTGMEAPRNLMPQPAQGVPYGGLGANPMPLPKGLLSGEMSLLYAKDLAKHGASQIEELDKAAKFRRALSMIQETFAEITGRPDIAERVRQRMVDEDQKRAAAVENQILARVGRQAMEEERLQEAAKQKAFDQKSEADKLQAKAQASAKSLDDFKYYSVRMPEADGRQLMDAIVQGNSGNAAPLAALRDQYWDEGAEEAANELGRLTGDAGKARLDIHRKEAGITAGTQLNTAQKNREAEFAFENDPARVAVKAKTREALGIKPEGDKPPTTDKAYVNEFQRRLDKHGKDTVAKANEFIATKGDINKGLPLEKHDKDLLRRIGQGFVAEVTADVAKYKELLASEKDPEAKKAWAERLKKAEEALALTKQM